MSDHCEICQRPAEMVHGVTFDGFRVECKRCGTFELSSSALGIGKRLVRTAQVRVSGWIIEQLLLGHRPRLLERDIRRIAQLPFPTMAERADQLLGFIASHHQNRLGDEFSVENPIYLALAYARDEQERDVVFQFLQWRGYVDPKNEVGHRRISSAGYHHLDELRQRQPDSAQAFVAMWFSPDVARVFEDGLMVGIAAAGYKPVRVDKVEHASRIDDEIIAQIRRSRFLVADFTGHHGGVYFEAGLAFGLGLPIIWTCRESDIEQLHFDIRQFNCLPWNEEDMVDFAQRLQLRIEAVLGRGPLSDSRDIPAAQ